MDARYVAVYPDLYARHWWWRARETILLKQVGRLLRGIPDARILDVGCGSGIFFEALEAFGRVEGIESDRASVEGSGRWRERMHVGGLDGAFVPSAPYDLIVMLDVLEHIHRPQDVLGVTNGGAGRTRRPTCAAAARSAWRPRRAAL